MTRKILTAKFPPKQVIKVEELTPKACLNCKFFNGSTEHPDSGECRRRPPFYNIDKEFSAWPLVKELDWCGEFKRLSQQVS